MMDIETFVQQDGRDELVKQVRGMIDEMGIQYLYLQFVSITGRICGKGIPADHWETVARAGFPAGLRRNRQPVPEQTWRISGLRAAGKGAGRYPGAGNLLPAALGQAGRPDLVHPVSQPGRARGSRRLPDLRQPRQSAPHPRAVPGRSRRPAPAPRHRAGDDVAQAGRGRQAGRRLLETLLLPYRPVREPASGLHAGDRIFPGDGAGHDPGGSRGRARPARAQLHLRRRAGAPPIG